MKGGWSAPVVYEDGVVREGIVPTTVKLFDDVCARVHQSLVGDRCHDGCRGSKWQRENSLRIESAYTPESGYR